QKFYQLLNQGKTSTTQRLSTANNTPIVQDAEFWFEQGNQKAINGDFIGAIASYDRALEIKPDYPEAWKRRGNALADLGRFEQAIASYDQAIKINPNYANAYYNKACCYGLQNNVELAIENLQRAINLDVKYQDMAKTDKDFEQIRGDERFQSFLNRV
ncbi:MAG: TPR end-of-group domain-containing protein, partial [Microcystis aeruginosa]